MRICRRVTDRRRVTLPVLAVALLAVTLLAGCAGGPGRPGDQPATSPVTPAPSATPTPATPAPSAPGFPMPTLPPTLLPPGRPTPPAAGEEVTLTGEVTAGVMDGCVLLTTDLGDYLLLGEAAADLRMGAIVRVRGQVRTDMATICQQGTPFEVTEVFD